MSPRPTVPAMLDLLESAYLTIAKRAEAADEDRQRLATIIADLRWYAARLGEERWERQPRPGRWSLAENIWHIAEQAIAAADAPRPRPVVYYIDHGKEHIGQAAEIFALFEY
ncbi:MAG: DinB family protein [Chloroflexia bacterium]